MCVARTLVKEKHLLVTGWWGLDPAAARFIGTHCGAVMDCPLSTVFKEKAKRRCEEADGAKVKFVTVPAGIILLAPYRAVHWNRQEVPTVGWMNQEFGATKERPSIPHELWTVMCDHRGSRTDWNYSTVGNEGLPILTKVENNNVAPQHYRWQPQEKVANQVAFDKWSIGTYQTVLWLGSSKPSKAAYAERS